MPIKSRSKLFIGSPVEASVVTRPDGVDYGWVLQTTFVLTIAVGAPAVAVLSLGTTLPTWETRADFALRVGAIVWLVTAVAVYGYARSSQSST